MAAIFQVRRGSGSVNLTDGELYLHKSSGSLQVSLGETPITLARLDQINSGSLVLSGDVTASNAYFSGDVAISGNLFLGNNATDNINALGVFTSNLTPGSQNQYNIGAVGTEWNNIYANTISASNLIGNIAGIDITEFSESVSTEITNLQIHESFVDSKFETLQSYTESVENRFITLGDYTGSIDDKFDSLQQYTESVEERFSVLEVVTSSLNLFTESADIRLDNLELFTESADIRLTNLESKSESVDISIFNINEYTASNNLNLTNQTDRLDNLESKSASVDVSLDEIHSYTSSLKTAIGLDGQNVTVYGDLIVEGTTTTIDSTQVNIGENILELNYGGNATEGGIYVKDGTGVNPTSGSLLWNSNDGYDYWVAGPKGNEAKILTDGMGVVSGSSQISIQGASDYDSLFGAIQQATSSLNSFTQSANYRLGELEIHSGALNEFTTSVENRFTTLGTYTSSVDDKFDVIQSVTESLYEFTQSTNIRLDNLESKSASVDISLFEINSFTESADIRLTNLESKSESVDISIENINNFTSSQFDINDYYNSFTESADIRLDNLELFTASVDDRFTTLAQVTGSLISATASLLISSSLMTASIAQLREDVDGLILTSDVAALGITVNGIKIATGSLNSFTSSQLNINSQYNTFTESADIRLDNLESKSASVDISIYQLNLFTQSADQRLDSIESVTSSFELVGSGILSSSIHEWPTTDGLDDQFLKTDGAGNLSFSNLDTMLEGIYTGEAITKGDPLYINGSNGANPIVYKADAADPSKMPVTYIAYETIGAGVGSRGIVLGLIEGMNLTGLAAGTEVYVAEGGGWATSRPTGENSIVQLLGIVTKEGSGGKGMVLNPGPATLPNLQKGKLWVGNETNQPVLVTTASFTNTASFNSYTQSANDRLTNLESGNSGDSARLTNLELFTASADIRLNNLQITSASHNVSIAQLNTYTSSLNSAIQLTGSTVSFLGDIVVYGTQSIINSENLAINDNLIYLNEGSTITNPDLGIVGNYNDGTYAHSGIFRDASDNGTWKVFKGYTPEPEGTIDAAHASFALADFKAANIIGTTIVGSIAATNGVISGSAQISAIFEEKASSTHTLVSGSSQIDLTTTTNYVSGIKTRLNAEGVISGSSQLTTEFDSRYLNTNGDGVFSGSAQIPNASITNVQLQNSSITIAGTVVSLGSAISLSTITNGSGIISGSSQITTLLPAGVVSGSSQVNADSITNFDANVLAYNNSLGVVSGSAQINVASTTGDIPLGTRTSGNYVATITAGTGVSTTGASTGEGIAHTISIGQAVATSSNVQFNSIGVGTTASGTAGEIRATGDITAYYSSDIRLKENIVPIPNALEKVKQISGNTYDWKEGYDEVHSHKGNDVGVIAQEIEAILPQIVTNRDTGFKAVQYEKIIPLLIEAIKELSAKIDTLENK